jgi:hypothetical protein
MSPSPRIIERYGEAPVEVGLWNGRYFTELMHWLYLPVFMPGNVELTIPRNLQTQSIDFMTRLALLDYEQNEGDWRDKYVYVTARRGFATPDNPLNRVGWHTDGFGTDDVNYIWCDRYPTQWLDAPTGIGDPSEDHLKSVEHFDMMANESDAPIREVGPGVVYRLSPYVIHCTPNVPAPGGMRSWVKVSVSEHRYNLIGNSHNWELDYDWEMVERDTLRNDPARAMNDFNDSSDGSLSQSSLLISR